MMKDLNAAAKRLVIGKNWDAHQLNPDALPQMETALDTAS